MRLRRSRNSLRHRNANDSAAIRHELTALKTAGESFQDKTMSANTHSPTRAEKLRHRWRFAIVLAASLPFAVAQPLTSGLFDAENSYDANSTRRKRLRYGIDDAAGVYCADSL